MSKFLDTSDVDMALTEDFDRFEDMSSYLVCKYGELAHRIIEEIERKNEENEEA